MFSLFFDFFFSTCLLSCRLFISIPSLLSLCLQYLLRLPCTSLFQPSSLFLDTLSSSIPSLKCKIFLVSLCIQVSWTEGCWFSGGLLVCSQTQPSARLYLFLYLYVSGYLQGRACVCVCVRTPWWVGGFISSCRWPRLLIHRSGEKSPPRVKAGEKAIHRQRSRQAKAIQIEGASERWWKMMSDLRRG